MSRNLHDKAVAVAWNVIHIPAASIRFPQRPLQGGDVDSQRAVLDDDIVPDPTLQLALGNYFAGMLCQYDEYGQGTAPQSN